MRHSRGARPVVQVIVGILVAVVVSAAIASVKPFGRAQQLGPWHLVFFDDFRHGLTASRWGRYEGQPGGDPGGWFSPSHAVVAGGILTLENYRDARFGRRWVSAGVSSAPALKQTYGKYEIRLRMDGGVGISVAALLWPVRDVWPPEVDFVENGGETATRNHITATLHFGADNRQIQRTVYGNFMHWHVFGVEWTPQKLVYTLDGRAWAAVRGAMVPSEAMELDVQSQAGTCGDRYAPCPRSSTPPHVNAQIDWVAAYSYKPRRR